jgi:hypothetical protein
MNNYNNKLNFLDNLDNISRHYDNIIILSHCRDELVFFYDFITHRTLLILVTKPASEREFFIINKFIIRKGCELVILDEPNTFNTMFTLSEKTKAILNYYSHYPSFNKLITQVKTTPESDIVSNKVFTYIRSLYLNNHYVLTYDKNNKKEIPELFTEYAQLYSKVYTINSDEINKKMLMFYNSYRSVTGITKV